MSPPAFSFAGDGSGDTPPSEPNDSPMQLPPDSLQSGMESQASQDVQSSLPEVAQLTSAKPPLQLQAASGASEKPVMQRKVSAVMGSTGTPSHYESDQIPDAKFSSQAEGEAMEKLVNKLSTLINSNNKKGFKDAFRAAWPSMDELMSCQATYDKARQMISQGASQKDINGLLYTSHLTRMPTSHMGHNITTQSGATSFMQHPTSQDTATYAEQKTAKGNWRWTGHTSMDRSRRKHVQSGSTTSEMQDNAISFSLNQYIQPPFASNSRVPQDQDDSKAMAAHQQREYLKTLHSGFDASQTQPTTAPYVQRPITAPPSPPRQDDSDDDMDLVIDTGQNQDQTQDTV